MQPKQSALETAKAYPEIHLTLFVISTNSLNLFNIPSYVDTCRQVYSIADPVQRAIYKVYLHRYGMEVHVFRYHVM